MHLVSGLNLWVRPLIQWYYWLDRQNHSTGASSKSSLSLKRQRNPDYYVIAYLNSLVGPHIRSYQQFSFHSFCRCHNRCKLPKNVQRSIRYKNKGSVNLVTRRCLFYTHAIGRTSDLLWSLLANVATMVTLDEESHITFSVHIDRLQHL